MPPVRAAAAAGSGSGSGSGGGGGGGSGNDSHNTTTQHLQQSTAAAAGVSTGGGRQRNSYVRSRVNPNTDDLQPSETIRRLESLRPGTRAQAQAGQRQSDAEQEEEEEQQIEGEETEGVHVPVDLDAHSHFRLDTPPPARRLSHQRQQDVAYRRDMLREDTFADAQEQQQQQQQQQQHQSIHKRAIRSNAASVPSASHSAQARRRDQRNDSSSVRAPLHPSSNADPEDNRDSRVTQLYTLARAQRTYLLLHLLHSDVKRTIDAHLTWDELTSVDLNYALVRPLAVKYARLRSLAVVYACLFVRMHFLREAQRDIAFQQVNQSRAMLCELLAIKLIRTFSADGLELVTALTVSFHPFVGLNEQDEEEGEDGHKGSVGEEEEEEEDVNRLASGFRATLRHLAQHSSWSRMRKSTSASSSPGTRPHTSSSSSPLPEHDLAQMTNSALELALLSSSKKFVNSPLVQKVVQGIWDGSITICNPGSSAILNDDYKRRPLSIYDPRTAPLLDHYRLRVPKIRSALEFANVLLLLLFYVLCLRQKDSDALHGWTTWETVFSVWIAGFALDEVAQASEHGFTVYFASVWNMIDSVFIAISATWFVVRLVALRTGSLALSDTSFDVLALGAVLLCPRVASSLVRDNVMLLALRAMITDFVL